MNESFSEEVVVGDIPLSRVVDALTPRDKGNGGVFLKYKKAVASIASIST